MYIAVTNAWIPWSDDDTIIYDPVEGVVKTLSGGFGGYMPAVTIDADQRLVVPGLADTHMHLLSTALEEARLDLRGAGSVEEILRLVREAAEAKAPGEWIVGRGWDQERLAEKRPPSIEELDAVAPRNPVLLVRVCGHAAVVNTRTLEATGLLEAGLGDLVEVVDGRPTGIIFEDAVYYVESRIPPPSLEEAARAVEKLLDDYLSLGVVRVYSMSASLLELDAYSAARTRVEYRAYVEAESLEVAHSLYPRLVEGVKLFADGSFGARTAALREPYSDGDTAGRLLLDRNGILEAAAPAVSAGLRVAVHAIGDRAVEEALAAARELGGRLRIEHASLTPPDILEGLGEVKPWVTVQPHFILSDTWIVERLGERARWVYAFKSMLARGVHLTGSSDSPVEPYNPWLGVYAAVDRGRAEGLPIWSVSSQERLEFPEALRLYTSAPEMPASIVVFNVRREPRSREEYERVRAETVFLGATPITPSREGVKGRVV